MKKYLLATVGVGRGVDQAISFSVRRNNPDVLLLIYSSASSATADSIRSILEGNDRLQIVDKKFEEVDDVEKLVKQYASYIDEVLKLGGTLSDITADYTSGTKSMSAALVSACLLKGVESLSVVIGERGKDNGGIVIAGTERLSVLSPNWIFTEQRLKLFKQLFNKYRFQGAIDILSDGLIYHELKEKADLLMTIAMAYDSWDRFEYQQASEFLNNQNLTHSEDFGIRKTLEQHKQILHRLKTSDGFQTMDAEDLFCNALRRAQEARYDDAVSRLYRLVELFAQMEFKSHYGFGTDAVDISKIPETIAAKLKPDDHGIFKIAMFDAFESLRHLDRPFVKKYFERLEDLKRLLSARNHSKLAHGHRPISKQTCERMIALMDDVFEIKRSVEFPSLS
jgi:CRISPR-associated protein (TIGR02710 family)